MAEIYTEQFVESCFYLWVENGCTFGRDLLDKLPKTEKGNRPNLITLQKWSEDHGWVERADALNAEASLALNKTAIERRVEMYEKHAKIGEELIKMGREFLNKQIENGGIKSENAALRAIELGVSIEEKSVGFADLARKLGDMTNEQLDRELQKLLGTKKDAEFIEGEATDVEPKE